ncbi:Molybdenum carrier [Balamuthia mandrillaris]
MNKASSSAQTTRQTRNQRTTGGGGSSAEVTSNKACWGSFPSSSSSPSIGTYYRQAPEPRPQTQTTSGATSGGGARGRGRGRGRGKAGERGRGMTERVETEVQRGRVTPVEEWAGKVVKIISGGETGADRAGLEAGRLLGIATGGTAPKNFRTEQGSDPTLKRLFGLTAEGDLGFAETTRKNVDDADGTIAFRLHEGNGTDKTIGWAHLRLLLELWAMERAKQGRWMEARVGDR